MIFYFSGSGNSLYVAQWLERNLEQPVFSIAAESTKKNVHYYPDPGEPVIFVCPVYFYGLPALVDDFLRRMEFFGKEIPVHLVLTCGDTPANAGGRFKRLLRRQNDCHLAGVYSVKMPDNYILAYNLAPAEKRKKTLAQAEKTLPLIKQAILTGIASKTITNQGSFAGLLTFNAYPLYIKGRKTAKFFADEKCTGCGLCAKVCPIGAIVMENGRPRWQKSRCNHCLACLHRCPVHASQYGKKTAKRDRYLHPKAQFSQE